jgi:hypothetical protein
MEREARITRIRKTPHYVLECTLVMEVVDGVEVSFSKYRIFKMFHVPYGNLLSVESSQ